LRMTASSREFEFARDADRLITAVSKQFDVSFGGHLLESLGIVQAYVQAYAR
jgi:hypothetical protein